jgi:hypothetical protein
MPSRVRRPCGTIGAIVWDLITWYGLPTSSSHALIGAYAGAAIAKSGFSAIIAAGWTKTLIFIVLPNHWRRLGLFHGRRSGCFAIDAFLVDKYFVACSLCRPGFQFRTRCQ